MNYKAETSEQFNEWVRELDKIPTINTFCVTDENDEPILNNGKAMVAEEFKLQSESLGEVEQYLMNRCNEYMKNKHVWIRVLPHIRRYANEETDEGTMIYVGRARIVAEEIIT